jgi:hypothetical protein
VTLLASVLGGVAASPASAATGVGYCFVDGWGQPYALGYTTLQIYATGHNGVGWYDWGTGTTAANGCGYFNTTHLSAYWIRVKVGTFTSKVYGTTPMMAQPGAGYGFLGTGVAYLGR